MPPPPPIHSSSKHSSATIKLIDELLKNVQLYVLATSREKLFPGEAPGIIGLEDNNSTARRNHRSLSSIKDVVEKPIQVRPLEPFDAAMLLVKVMNRTLHLNEMTSDSTKNVPRDEMGWDDWIKSLANRPAVKATKGFPQKIKDLALQLEGKRMGELDSTGSISLSERSICQEEMVASEVRFQALSIKARFVAILKFYFRLLYSFPSLLLTPTHPLTHSPTLPPTHPYTHAHS